MRIGLGATRMSGDSLQCRAVGNALLIHPKGAADPQAAEFTAGLAPDPQHTLAVVDLPFGELNQWVEAVVRQLADQGSSLRLVFARATAPESRLAARRIAERLVRPVIVPDGEVLPTLDGGLFVPSDQGAGWLRYRPGRAAERDSRRFPKPRWEFSLFDRPWRTSGHGVVESVPSGVWLRSPQPDSSLDASRRLVDGLPSHPDILTVVLGSPGGQPVLLRDVVRFWDTVLLSARSRVRFLPFGPVALPNGAGALGQELADALGQQVVLYAGVPVGAETGLGSPDVIALFPDGSPGHRPFFSELMYFPRTGDTILPPDLFGLHEPVFGVPEISTGVYEYASDAVLEVVQCGLWIRPLAEPADGDAVRRIPPAPGHSAILYDRSTPAAEQRMRSLAEDVLWRLAPDRRAGVTIEPADAPSFVTAGPSEEAFLWSGDDATLSGPDSVAESLLARPPRPVGVAPWVKVPEAGHEEHAAGAAPGDVAAQTPALASLDPDPPVAAVRVGGSGAATRREMRTEPDALAKALPNTESDDVNTSLVLASSGDSSVRTARTAPAVEHAVPGAAGPGAWLNAERPCNRLAGGPPPQPSPVPEARRQRASETGRLPALDPGNRQPDPSPAPRALFMPAAQVDRAALLPLAPPASDGPPAPAVPRDSVIPQGPVAPNAPLAPEGPVAQSAQATSAPPSVPDGVLATEAGPPRSSLAPAIPPSADVAPTALAPQSAGAECPLPARVIRLESDAPPASREPATAAVPDGPARRNPESGTDKRARSRTPNAGARVQSVPSASASAVPPGGGTARERDWVRRTFSTQYNAAAGTISRVMSETPGLRGTGRQETTDALTDLVTVRLYLSGDSAQVNDAVRAGSVGPHVPLARCVASGLRRLPSYRGAALLRARASAAERAWYQEGRLVTEWAFCTAYTAPHEGPKGGTDFLIWSMTARRTSLIDAAEPYRVMFTPGTTFKVLRASVVGGPVLLRELSPAETVSAGEIEGQRVSLDEIALEGLNRAANALNDEDASPGGRSWEGDSLDKRFGTPPGLVGAGTREKTSATDKGAKL